MSRTRVVLGDALAALIDHRGKTPKKLGGDWSSGGHRVVSALNIKDGRVDDNDHHYVTDALYERWMKVPLKEGDVLLTSEAPTGEVALLDSDTDWCLGQRLFGLRGKPGLLDGRYLFYLLRGGDVRNQLMARTTGTTVSGIRQSELVKVELDLPLVEEQREIAATLGALDDKIDSNRRAIDAAEELGDALFVASSDSSTVLSEAALLTMGSSPPGSSYNEDGVGLPFYQGVTDFGRRYPGLRVWTTEPVRVAEANDALVSVRAPVGELNRASETCCIGRGVASVRSPTPSVLYYALRAASDLWEPFQQEGTVFGAINRTDLAAAKLPWPNAGILAAVEADLSALDERIGSLSREINHLTELRDALLPELLSGRIRVPEPAVPDRTGA